MNVPRNERKAMLLNRFLYPVENAVKMQGFLSNEHLSKEFQFSVKMCIILNDHVKLAFC